MTIIKDDIVIQPTQLQYNTAAEEQMLDGYDNSEFFLTIYKKKKMTGL